MRSLISVAVITAFSTTTRAQVFQTLDFLPGTNASWASGASADGSVIVGNCGTDFSLDPQRAFRWTLSTGMVDLGTLSALQPMGAAGVSWDGLIIAGTSGGSSTGAVAFRWDGALHPLGSPPPFCGSGLTSNAISGDGRTIVGTCISTSFRWFALDGLHGFFYPGWGIATHRAASFDGSVVCGRATTPASGNLHAYRWTAATGPVDLGSLPGIPSSDALGTSGDGNTIVGTSANFSTGIQLPFRWTPQTGMVQMPILAGATTSSANAVSADGSVVVGTSLHSGAGHSWVITPNLGLADVRVLLESLGVDMSPWTSLQLGSISPDGRVLLGSVFDQNLLRHACIVRLPASLLCYANCDASTAAPVLNANDFQCFLNRFAAEDAGANCDGSTAAPILNANDFQCFLNRFAAGCT